MTLGDGLGVAGLVVGVLGLIVAVLGFKLTIQQLKRTATATEATVDAMKTASRQMNANYLLVLLPQLRALESEIDSATHDNDINSAMNSLRSYRSVSTQVSTLLKLTGDPVHTQLIDLIDITAEAAAQAKASLASGKTKSVRVAVQDTTDGMNKVFSQATELAIKFQVRV